MIVREKNRFNHNIVHINMHSIFQYIFIFCVILNFRSVWLHSVAFEMTGKIVKILLVVSVLLGILCNGKLSSVEVRRCLNAVGVVTLYGVIWYLLDPLKSISIFYILLQLFAIVIYSLLIETSIDDTLHKYTNIVLIIAIVSLVFWIFGTICGIIKPTGYFYSTWSGSGSVVCYKNYYGIYFEQQSASSSSIVERLIGNKAIFTEGPMASMVFAVAFLAEFLMQRKLNVTRCCILLMAVVSTISVAGLTMVILAIGLKYILSRAKTRDGHMIKIVMVPIISIIGFMAIFFLVEQKLMTNSGLTRLDDFVAGYKAWMDAPLFGNGYGNSAAFIQYMGSFRINNTGFSNSVMQILVFGGIYLLLPYIVALGGIVRLFRKQMYQRMLFYMVFFYAFTITICSFQMLTLYLFVSMAKDGK